MVSYITEPFKKSGSELGISHQNQWEAIQIARIFNQLGYVADIIDYEDYEFEPDHSYDILFGIGTTFERLARIQDSSTFKIYYATGAHWSFQNTAEEERLRYLEFRRGVRLPPRRAVRPHRSADLANVVLCCGNSFTSATYHPYNSRVVQIDISSFDHLEWPRGKNFGEARTHFLWFGSAGMVHKGLDLVLDVFRELPYLNLYVCGPVTREPEFVHVYRQELFGTPNIKLIGWVDINSKAFEWVTERCGFILYPSCSEGMAGSVLTCMHRGLIPIVTKESGVDTEGIGVTLRDARLKTIRDAVLEAARQPTKILEGLSKKVFQEAKRRYTRHLFSYNFEKVMRHLLLGE